jgi:hypothetical protein
MQPLKNRKYNYGSYTQTIKTPTEPTHTRTVFFEIANDGTPYTSRFRQAIIHNNNIHGLTTEVMNVYNY